MLDLLHYCLEILHDYLPDSILTNYLNKYSLTLKVLLDIRAQKRKYDGTMLSNEDDKEREKELTASLKKLKTSDVALAKAAKNTKALTCFFQKK